MSLDDSDATLDGIDPNRYIDGNHLGPMLSPLLLLVVAVDVDVEVHLSYHIQSSNEYYYNYVASSDASHRRCCCCCCCDNDDSWNVIVMS